jgi:hypothetical protein
MALTLRVPHEQAGKLPGQRACRKILRDADVRRRCEVSCNAKKSASGPALVVEEGVRVGLIGRKGSAKSTRNTGFLETMMLQNRSAERLSHGTCPAHSISDEAS